MTLDNDTREELANYALELLQDKLINANMDKLNQLVDDDRYYNWYNGFTEVYIPRYVNSKYDANEFYVDTYATSGTISTLHFGENFDAEKVQPRFSYQVHVFPPAKSGSNESISLHFEIEKISLQKLPDGTEDFIVDGPGRSDDGTWRIKADIGQISKNYTPPLASRYQSSRAVKLLRKVYLKDVRKLQLTQMPGFKFSWFYSGPKIIPTRGFSIKYSHNRRAFLR